MRRDSSDRREAIEQQTIASSFLTLFWLLLLVMPLFHAWYIVWSFPLAVLLLPQRRALAASIVFTHVGACSSCPTSRRSACGIRCCCNNRRWAISSACR